MTRLRFYPYLMIVIWAFNPSALFSQQKPISLNPLNPHYFLYQGKPTVLITSGEHYGSVLNLDFDFVRYLDELKSDDLNLTRTFTGAYIEPQGAFNIAENTLAPAANRYVCPWKRSAEPGYSGGGNKFDLGQWDEAYFVRLKEFIAAAEKRGIVVELAMFCPFYEEVQWKLSPMNIINNVNGVGNTVKDDVYTMDKHGGLLAIHDAMVRKIVNELKDFSNLIYEICNEPYFGGVKMEWQHHIASVISEAEKSIGVRHLISQNIANSTARIKDPHPDVSVFNFHYATPPVAVKQNYHLGKVIGDNETGFSGQQDSTYRKEGWEFILAGGGLYNNLDYSFTTKHEDGTFDYTGVQPGGGSKSLRNQLHYLKDFIHQFDFVKMKPDTMTVTAGLPHGARVHVLSEAGKQYAIYLLRGKQVNLSMALPPGKYQVEWMDPVTGTYLKKEKLQHARGVATIASPEYIHDIAVRIIKK